MTGTVRKHTPTLEALQVLYHRMRYEYDFYSFVRDQFHLAKKKIGLRSAARSSAYSHDFLRDLALRTPLSRPPYLLLLPPSILHLSKTFIPQLVFLPTSKILIIFGF